MDDDTKFESDIEFEEDHVGDQLKKLKEKLKICQREAREHLDGWQRAKADLINSKKETIETQKRLTEFANEELLEDILPVLDSFSLAFSNKKAWEKVDSNWRHGVEYIHQQLAKALAEYGLEEIDVKEGDPFDATIHQAIEHSGSGEEEVVGHLVQKGYRLKDKVLRPAQVNVSSK